MSNNDLKLPERINKEIDVLHAFISGFRAPEIADAIANNITILVENAYLTGQHDGIHWARDRLISHREEI